MRYVRRVLQPGETVVYATRLHPVMYWRAILLLIIAIILGAAAWHTADYQNLGLALGIAAAIFALLALSSALRAFIRRASTELAVTDQRVIYKTGLLARHTLEMNRARVRKRNRRPNPRRPSVRLWHRHRSRRRHRLRADPQHQRSPDISKLPHHRMIARPRIKRGRGRPFARRAAAIHRFRTSRG